MKKYGKFFGIIAALVLLIAAATFTYGKMKDQVKAPSLVEGKRVDDEKEPSDSKTGQETTGEASTEPGQEPSGNEGDQRQEAIDVTFYDREGNAVKLSDFYGKPIVMNFWTTWCVYCKKEMPDFQEVCEEYADQVVFLFINATDGQRETKEKAEAYLKEQGYTIPVYYDLDTEASYVYSVNSLPTTILLDKEGRVAAYVPGLLEKERLTAALDVLVGE